VSPSDDGENAYYNPDGSPYRMSIPTDWPDVRSCLFCGGIPPTARMSNEHIIGDWLAERMDPGGLNRRELRGGATSTNPGLRERTYHARIPESPWQRRTGRVCTTCNTWLADHVEVPIRDTVLSLMKGRRTELSAAESEALALWCARIQVTATAADWGTRSFVAPWQARMIREEAMPPFSFTMWIGCVEESPLHVSQTLITIPDHEHSGVTAGRAVYTAIAAGYLFLHFRSCDTLRAELSASQWTFAKPYKFRVDKVYDNLDRGRAIAWPNRPQMTESFAMEGLAIEGIIPRDWVSRTGGTLDDSRWPD